VQSAPARDNTQPKTGTARIRGHVFAADSGQPLRKVVVRASSPELRESRVTSTDAEGAYEFKELPAGRYSLNASKGSYVGLSYGQLRPFEAGKPLEVLDGQTIEKVDFSLPRGAIITGRVVDEFGEPIADVQVVTMRYMYRQGRRQLQFAGRMASTNDIGEYRIFGLSPGQYYLSATLRGFTAFGGESDDRSGYAPTYYPGTANAAEAQRLTIGLGQTLNEMNLQLIPLRTARVTGMAVDSDGKPLSTGFINVTPRGNGGLPMMMNGTQIRPDGSFTINGLAPGEYTLQLQSNVSNPLGGPPDFASIVVTMAGEDVTGVRLVTTRMSGATGRVIVDGAADAIRPSTIRISASPAQPDDAMYFSGSGIVKDDWAFELRTRPGLMVVRAFAPSGDWRLKAVRLNGADVTDSGIEFKPNEDVSGIEIEITTKTTEISGLVMNSRGEASKDYTVVVFARDQERWTGPTRFISTGRPDQDGRFKIRGLPPAQYFAVALDYVEPGDSNDPEFLDRIKSKASTLSLGEGETKTVDLKLNSAS
jgi:hypothetical protein